MLPDAFNDVPVLFDGRATYCPWDRLPSGELAAAVAIRGIGRGRWNFVAVRCFCRQEPLPHWVESCDAYPARTCAADVEALVRRPYQA